MPKLHSLADRRFLYRSQVTAASIAPANAARILELSREWLDKGCPGVRPILRRGDYAGGTNQDPSGSTLFTVWMCTERPFEKGREKRSSWPGTSHSFYQPGYFGLYPMTICLTRSFPIMPGTGRSKDKGQILDLYERFLKEGAAVFVKPWNLRTVYRGS